MKGLGAFDVVVAAATFGFVPSVVPPLVADPLSILCNACSVSVTAHGGRVD